MAPSAGFILDAITLTPTHSIPDGDHAAEWLTRRLISRWLPFIIGIEKVLRRNNAAMNRVRTCGKLAG
jgi:hypothetical protein